MALWTSRCSLTFIRTALKREIGEKFDKNLTSKGEEVFDHLFIDSSVSKKKSSNTTIISCSQLDLADSGLKNLTKEMMELLLVTTDEELVERTMCTLFLHFSRKSMVVQRFSEMHLLIDDDSVEVYLEIVDNIAVLKNNIDSFESWGREGEGEVSKRSEGKGI